jgi:hypothetical protein
MPVDREFRLLPAVCAKNDFDKTNNSSFLVAIAGGFDEKAAPRRRMTANSGKTESRLQALIRAVI